MRDLGGLPTRDGGHTASGRLIRSDNLQDLTKADVQHLVDELGVTDIVDLRTDAELHAEGPGPLVEVESLTHHHHSLIAEKRDDDADVEAVGARALPWRDETRSVTPVLGRALPRLPRRAAPTRCRPRSRWSPMPRGRVVVHCAAGKDRTGTVVAMALDVAGVPHDDIVADYVLTAERLEQIVGRLMPRDAYGGRWRSRPRRPAAQGRVDPAILTAVARGLGGAAGWLVAHGWSDDESSGSAAGSPSRLLADVDRDDALDDHGAVGAHRAHPHRHVAHLGPVGRGRSRRRTAGRSSTSRGRPPASPWGSSAGPSASSPRRAAPSRPPARCTPAIAWTVPRWFCTARRLRMLSSAWCGRTSRTCGRTVRK